MCIINVKHQYKILIFFDTMPNQNNLRPAVKYMKNLVVYTDPFYSNLCMYVFIT